MEFQETSRSWWLTGSAVEKLRAPGAEGGAGEGEAEAGSGGVLEGPGVGGGTGCHSLALLGKALGTPLRSIPSGRSLFASALLLEGRGSFTPRKARF